MIKNQTSGNTPYIFSHLMRPLPDRAFFHWMGCSFADETHFLLGAHGLMMSWFTTAHAD
jgi:hypothetical protein